MSEELILRTFWVWHKSEEGPDCECALSYAEDNPDAWQRMTQEVRDRYGDALDSEREIEVRVDYDAVLKHWWPDPIDGTISDA